MQSTGRAERRARFFHAETRGRGENLSLTTSSSLLMLNPTASVLGCG
jgi:hypothetical protein